MQKILDSIIEWITYIPEAFRKADYDEDEYDLRLRQHKRVMYIRTVLFIVLGIGAIILLRSIYIHWTYQSYKVIESEDVFDSVSEYESVNGKVLRYSPDGAVLMKADMKEEIWNESFNLSQPVVEKTGDIVMIYDKRGTEIHVYDMEGRLGSFVTNSPIVFARVGGSGNVAAAIENGDGTEIVYYNPAGEEIAAVSPSAVKYGYPVSAAVSEDGNILAVSYVTAESGVIGSRLAFYNFGSAGSEKEDHLVASEDFVGVMIPEIRWFGRDELIAFSDNGFTVYKGVRVPKKREVVRIDGEIVSLFYDDERLAFISRCDETEHRYLMDVYRHDGNKLNTSYVDIIYDKGDFSNGEIVFSNSNEMAVYTENGNLRFSGTMNEGTLLDVIRTGRNRYFLISDTCAEMIKLK